MAEEARIHVSTGFSGGISVNLRANTPAELEQLVSEAAVNSPTLTRLMQQVGLVTVTVPQAVEQQAIQTVQQAFPGAQVVAQPQSTVGQPVYQQQPQVVQQPAVVAQPAQQAQQNNGSNPQRIPGPAGGPPGIAYPGPCAHGDRVYNDKPARGKAWQRWECNIPWSRNAQGRCESVNV